MNPNVLVDMLTAAAAGGASALRAVTRLVPAGGEGDKVFPPTYADGPYATEKRVVDGALVDAVLLDSAQSQANRLEDVLYSAYLSGECEIPILAVDIPGHDRITTLNAPHRVFDAIFRDCLLDGQPFRASSVGRRLVASTYANATALFEYCPTALVFGAWDSTSIDRSPGTKFARAITSEIVGFNAVPGVRTGGRLDPLGIKSGAGPVYLTADGSWTLDESAARQEKGKPVKSGRDGRPSEINHGNVTPTIDPGKGGVTISEARQTTVLSLPQLRRLHFPAPGDTGSTPDRDVAGRTVLAVLALYAIAMQQEAGYYLRSRCHLVPVAPPVMELIGPTAADRREFSVTADAARRALTIAYEQAAARGLTWRAGVTLLQPAPNLLQLVSQSDQLIGASEG